MKSNFNQGLGHQLKQARQKAQLTQAQVMHLTGINNKTLSGYENGLSQPDLATLASLAKLYQLSLDQILELKPEPELSQREKSLLQTFRSLPSERQMEALVQLKALAYYLEQQTKKETIPTNLGE